MQRRSGVFGTALLIGASASVLMPTAWASEELARKHNCLACHALDKEVVGPAYQDVARRYKGRKDAEATVAANIRKGGVGKWGQVPMPAQTTLSDADTQALARWILGLAR
jgi:cytochrome c